MKVFIRQHKRVLMTVVVLFLILFEVGYAGNVTYVIKWVSCGERPVLFEKWDSSFFGVQPLNIRITQNPGFLTEKTFFFNNSYKLYCKTSEAENAANKIPYSVVRRNY